MDYYRWCPPAASAFADAAPLGRSCGTWLHEQWARQLSRQLRYWSRQLRLNKSGSSHHRPRRRQLRLQRWRQRCPGRSPSAFLIDRALASLLGRGPRCQSKHPDRQARSQTATAVTGIWCRETSARELERDTCPAPAPRPRCQSRRQCFEPACQLPLLVFLFVGSGHAALDFTY